MASPGPDVSGPLSHRDPLGRTVHVNPALCDHHHFIRPSDGRLVPLILQTFESEATHPESRGWTRIGPPRSNVHPLISLTLWIWAPTVREGSTERIWSSKAVLQLILRWLACWPIYFVQLLIASSDGSSIFGPPNENPRYASIQYKDWTSDAGQATHSERASQATSGRSRSPSPRLERSRSAVTLRELSFADNTTETDEITRDEDTAEIDDDAQDEDFDNLPGRHYRPRYLCFLESHSSETEGVPAVEIKTKKVSEWMREHDRASFPEYCFVSYTRVQFRVQTEEEMLNWEPADPESRRANLRLAVEDRARLIQAGIKAAVGAGVEAFWLDFECVRENDGTARATVSSYDVYRICDVIRAARSMVVVVGPLVEDRLMETSARSPLTPAIERQWLQQWGSRLWTLPELLLCPSEYRIGLFVIGSTAEEPERYTKRSFAARACSDVRLVRQLIDHYESSIHLTPLELICIALECFKLRQTNQFSKGDMVYALMGLLRRRPPICKDETAFEAFARLSMANDSDHLLERLLCVLPPRHDAQWYDFVDFWGAKLWDINPSCQVAKVLGDQSVLLDGASGTPIEWTNMDYIKLPKPSTWGVSWKFHYLKAPILSLMVVTVIGFRIAVVDASSVGAATFVWTYFYYLVLGILMSLCAPLLVHQLIFPSSQQVPPSLIGVEGKIDPVTAERKLFGFNYGRMRCPAENGNVSSGRYFDATLTDSDTPVGEADDKDGDQHIFTIIDTGSLTVTSFRCKNPPVVLLICGQEGGMQRGLLCSYNWKTNTFCRETVIKVNTTVLDRMTKVDKVRLSYLPLDKSDTSRDRYSRTPPSLDESDPTLQSHLPGEPIMSWKVDLIFSLSLLFSNTFSPQAIAIVSPYELTSLQEEIADFATFTIAQFLAIYLLSRFHSGRMLSIAIAVQGLSLMLSLLQTDSIAGAWLIRSILVMTSSLSVAACIYITSSWYTHTQMMVRIPIWMAGGSLLTSAMDLAIWGVLGSNFSALRFAFNTLIAVLLRVMMAIFVAQLLGTPGETRWLPSYERMCYSLSGAARSVSFHRRVELPWTKMKLSKALCDFETPLILGIAVLNQAGGGLTEYLGSTYWPTTGARLMIVGLEAVLLTLVTLAVGKSRLSKNGSVILIIILITTSLVVSLTDGYLPSHLRWGLSSLTYWTQSLIVPSILWVLIAQKYEDPTAHLSVLAASLVAMSGGKTLYECLPSKRLALGRRVFLGVELVMAVGLLGYLLWRSSTLEQSRRLRVRQDREAGSSGYDQLDEALSPLMCPS